MFALVVIIFSLCFGSFLNVLIVRVPLEKSVILPSSACMSCGKPLRFYHNIPILSYLFLRGKCGFCKARISPLYPIIELSSAILGYILYLKFGFDFGHYEVFFIIISVLLLLALAVIDYKIQAVPDSINFSAFIFAIIGGVLYSGNLGATLMSAFSLAGFFTLLRFGLQSILQKETLGEGDIIIVATMGALVGWKLALLGVFFSAVFALIPLLLARQKDKRIPYIPFLLLGLLCVMIFDEFFTQFIFNLYRI